MRICFSFLLGIFCYKGTVARDVVGKKGPLPVFQLQSPQKTAGESVTSFLFGLFVIKGTVQRNQARVNISAKKAFQLNTIISTYSFVTVRHRPGPEWGA